MKTGILFFIVAIFATFVLALLAGFALDAVLPAGRHVNFEGLGRLTFILLLFIAPMAFALGYRRQTKKRSQQPEPGARLESLRPVDHQAIKRMIMQQRATRDDQTI